jgi:hypothetical protein
MASAGTFIEVSGEAPAELQLTMPDKLRFLLVWVSLAVLFTRRSDPTGPRPTIGVQIVVATGAAARCTRSCVTKPLNMRDLYS